MKKNENENLKSLQLILIVVIGFGLLINLKEIRKSQEQIYKMQINFDKVMFPVKYYKEEIKDFKKIDAKKFEELFKGKEVSVVMVGNESCGHCQRFAPILNKVSKEEKVTINYLDSSIVKKEDSEKIVKLDKQFKDNIFYTPYTVAMKEGKVIDFLPGAVNEEEIKTFFKNLKNEK